MKYAIRLICTAGVTAILAVLVSLGADSLPLMMGFLFVGSGAWAS